MSILPSSIRALSTDVDPSSWYAGPLEAMYEKGFFGDDELFRPSDRATRADFIELIVNLRGGVSSDLFEARSFDDVPASYKLFRHFETAGEEGWLKGQKGCLGTHPCFAQPDQPINRAEASTLMMRAFEKQGSDNAPTFDDNPEGQWYTEHIRSAANLCILRGDDGTKNVRPADFMNRAEMVTMLYRIHANLTYPHCDAGTKDVNLPQAPTDSVSSFQTGKWSISSGNSPSGIVDIITGFQTPHSLKVSRDGSFFVLDTVAGEVILFSEDLQLKNIIEGGMNYPTAVDFDQAGTMLIADYRNGRVLRFSKDGTLLGTFFDNPPIPELSFAGPAHVYVDQWKNIWVTDYQSHLVFKFDPSGSFIGWIGGKEGGGTTDGFALTGISIATEEPGGFDQPHMITVDRNGNLYIAGTNNHRIQKFDEKGKFIGWIGANTNGVITNGWSSIGNSSVSSTLGGFNRPTAIFMVKRKTAADDVFLVTDTDNNRIQKFTLNGKFTGWIGGKEGGGVTAGWQTSGTARAGAELGAFRSPFEAQLVNGKLYVTDTGNRRVQIIHIEQ